MAEPVEYDCCFGYTNHEPDCPQGARFKPGDRVAVYQSNHRIVLKISSISDDGTLYFDSKDNPGHINYVAHPKQCRRLVKNPRRRVWVYINEDGAIVGPVSEVNAEEPSYERDFGWLQFVEVRKKK